MAPLIVGLRLGGPSNGRRHYRSHPDQSQSIAAATPGVGPRFRNNPDICGRVGNPYTARSRTILAMSSRRFALAAGVLVGGLTMVVVIIQNLRGVGLL